MNQQLIVAVFALLFAAVPPVNVLASEFTSQLLPIKLQDSGYIHLPPGPWIMASISWLDPEQVDEDEDIELNAVADDRLMDGQQLIRMNLSNLGNL